MPTLLSQWENISPIHLSGCIIFFKRKEKKKFRFQSLLVYKDNGYKEIMEIFWIWGNPSISLRFSRKIGNAIVWAQRKYTDFWIWRNPPFHWDSQEKQIMHLFLPFVFSSNTESEIHVASPSPVLLLPSSFSLSLHLSSFLFLEQKSWEDGRAIFRFSRPCRSSEMHFLSLNAVVWKSLEIKSGFAVKTRICFWPYDEIKGWDGSSARSGLRSFRRWKLSP